MDLAKLDADLRAAVPAILGVSIGRAHDKETWRVDWATEPTPQELAAAQAVIDGFDPAVPSPSQFYARDLLALLTDDDQAAIDAALAANVTWRRIWNALLAQGDQPIRVTSDRFLAGWAGLTQALGQARVDGMALALGIVLAA